MSRHRPPAGFRLGGQSFRVANTPATVLRAIACLEQLPFKELIGMAALADRLGLRRRSFREYSAHPALARNRYQMHNEKTIYWGSRRTIAELVRQIALNEKENLG